MWGGAIDNKHPSYNIKLGELEVYVADHCPLNFRVL